MFHHIQINPVALVYTFAGTKKRIMSKNENITGLIDKLKESFELSKFIKLTISNKRARASDLNNVFVKPVIIKNVPMLSFVARYSTKDITSNFNLEKAAEQIETLLNEEFFNADLFTSDADFLYASNKKGNSRLLRKPPSSTELPVFRHDKIKNRPISAENNIYLRELGVLNSGFRVKADMQDKFKQINHYVSLADDVLSNASLPENFVIADMGSGKGYLTFALYDYLRQKSSIPFSMTGVELRPALVDFCNSVAQKSGFETLNFETGSIADAQLKQINVLIALHACDTATDEAIYRGITSGAEVIMVAPCCHKQIRKQINPGNIMKEITRFGIFEERQAETLTDSLRALYLEAWGYKTSVMEFIATEHTPKNVMITGIRKKAVHQPISSVLKRIDELKTFFGIKEHHLETLLSVH